MSTATDDIDDWIDDVSGLDFPVIIQKLSARLFNWLENNGSKQNKVSLIVLNMYKRVMDYI